MNPKQMYQVTVILDGYEHEAMSKITDEDIDKLPFDEHVLESFRYFRTMSVHSKRMM